MPIENRTISGHVSLSDGEDPEGIAYWLDGYDIKGFTGPNGWFYIQIPPSGSMQQGTEMGIFRLYFYMGNYRWTYANIFVINGMVASNHGDVGLSGEIVKPLILQKLIDIDLKVASAHVVQQGDTVYSTVTITPCVQDELVRFFTVIRQGYLLASYIYSLDDLYQLPAEYWLSSATMLVYSLKDTSVTFRHPVMTSALDLPPGNYRIVPWIHLLQTDLPLGFRERYGHAGFRFNLDFIDIPYRRQVDDLWIISRPSSQ